MSQPYAASQLAASTLQIAKASGPWALTGLSRLADAEDQDEFKMPPVDDGGAYRHAAYWQAVASRILASTPLLYAAIEAQRNASATSLLSMGDTHVGQILTDAMQNVQRAIGAAPHATATAEASRVQSILANYSTPAALEVAQKNDDSYAGWLRQWQKNMQSAGKVAMFVTAGVGVTLVAALVWYLSRKTGRRLNTAFRVARAGARTVKRISAVTS